MLIRIPNKREVLKRLPPAELEYLAMTTCDEGAMLPGGIHLDPNNPERYIVKTSK